MIALAVEIFLALLAVAAVAFGLLAFFLAVAMLGAWLGRL